MKRSSLSILLLLAVVFPTFAFQDPKYSNLEFTVLDEEAKTVSVKAVDKSKYTAESILNIPSSATDSLTEITYSVTTIAADGFKGIKIKKITLPLRIQMIIIFFPSTVSNLLIVLLSILLRSMEKA